MYYNKNGKGAFFITVEVPEGSFHTRQPETFDRFWNVLRVRLSCPHNVNNLVPTVSVQPRSHRQCTTSSPPSVYNLVPHRQCTTSSPTVSAQPC
jgi:hypothetical protein